MAGVKWRVVRGTRRYKRERRPAVELSDELSDESAKNLGASETISCDEIELSE